MSENKLDVLLQLLEVSNTLEKNAETPEEAFELGLKVICSNYHWPVGHVYVPNESGDQLISKKIWYLENSSKFNTFKSVTEASSFVQGVGLPGRVWKSESPAWIVDVTKDPNFPRAKQAQDIGVKAAFAFPILMLDKVKAVWEFYAEDAFEPDQGLLTVIGAVSSQISRTLERFYAADYHRRALSIADKSQRMIDAIEVEMNALSKSNAGIESGLREIEDMIRRVKIVSFNARIEASKLGMEGAKFDVVANEIARMSQDMEKSGGEVSSEVLSSQNNNLLLMDRIREVTNILREVQGLKDQS